MISTRMFLSKKENLHNIKNIYIYISYMYWNTWILLTFQMEFLKISSSSFFVWDISRKAFRNFWKSSSRSFSLEFYRNFFKDFSKNAFSENKNHTDSVGYSMEFLFCNSKTFPETYQRLQYFQNVLHNKFLQIFHDFFLRNFPVNTYRGCYSSSRY